MRSVTLRWEETQEFQKLQLIEPFVVEAGVKKTSAVSEVVHKSRRSDLATQSQMNYAQMNLHEKGSKMEMNHG